MLEGRVDGDVVDEGITKGLRTDRTPGVRPGTGSVETLEPGPAFSSSAEGGRRLWLEVVYGHIGKLLEKCVIVVWPTSTICSRAWGAIEAARSRPHVLLDIRFVGISIFGVGIDMEASAAQ